MTDLDKSGTFREWVRTYLGPSVGWVLLQVSSIISVITAGTAIVPAGTTIVAVDVAGLVTIQLPTAINNLDRKSVV